MRLKHMLKANRNELTGIALAACLLLNSGFTAPSEQLAADSKTETPVVEQTTAAPSAPSMVSVGEGGALSLSNADQKNTFGLIEPSSDENEITETSSEVAADDSVELSNVEGEPAEYVDPIVEEDYAEEISNVEEPYDSGEPGYGAIMAMEATAYTPYDGGGSGYTAMGIPATYGVAAVDPSVIPLGSRLYVPGYGEAIAADTGGAIYGYRIDLCMDSYEAAMSFGRQVVTVYLLDY